jgi:hypothetical protein
LTQTSRIGFYYSARIGAITSDWEPLRQVEGEINPGYIFGIFTTPCTFGSNCTESSHGICFATVPHRVRLNLLHRQQRNRQPITAQHTASKMWFRQSTHIMVRPPAVIEPGMVGEDRETGNNRSRKGTESRTVNFHEEFGYPIVTVTELLPETRCSAVAAVAGDIFFFATVSAELPRITSMGATSDSHRPLYAA